jgi:hypothetical protein
MNVSQNELSFHVEKTAFVKIKIALHKNCLL